MLCSIKDLDGYAIAARDGEIGKVRDCYFDDERWVVRQFVVQTGWLSGRSVPISPHAIDRVDRGARRLQTVLTREQVKGAPDIDTERPVSRQHETELYNYYGYPYWWSGAGLWGAEAFPIGFGEPPPLDESARRDMAAAAERSADPHLRSSLEVSGYTVEANDGAVGHIADFLFDDRSWAIRYAVVDTRNWLPGRHVLIAPSWIARIDWAQRTARVNLSRAAVESSPPYDRDKLGLSDDDEERMLEHYRRLGL